MIVLARGAAIPGVHTSFTHLETSTPLFAALGTAGVCRLIHDDYPTISTPPIIFSSSERSRPVLCAACCNNNEVDSLLPSVGGGRYYNISHHHTHPFP